MQISPYWDDFHVATDRAGASIARPSEMDAAASQPIHKEFRGDDEKVESISTSFVSSMLENPEHPTCPIVIRDA